MLVLKQMDKIAVTNIQRLCVNDGPGVRTVVFLRGCSLQCPWCCNPETIHVSNTEIFDKGTCDYPTKKIYCEQCTKFGGNRLITECPTHAHESIYKEYTPEELISYLTMGIYDGVTFSGGEPLLQISALLPLIANLKQNGISVAFETSLFVPCEYFERALPYVDHWLVDLKFQYGYIPNREFKVPLDNVFINIRQLQHEVPQKDITYRMVLMHEAMVNVDAIMKRLIDNKIAEIELLECHSLAENKYSQLHMPFKRFNPPTKDDIEQISSLLNMYNIQNTYSRI